MTKNEAIAKAQIIVDKMHGKYHSTLNEECRAYSDAYKATVCIREFIEQIDYDKKNEECQRLTAENEALKEAVRQLSKLL